MTTAEGPDTPGPSARAAAPDRTVTVSDVAERAGVSRASVSYALSRPERASKTMLDRVTRAAAELGYVGNDAARQLRMGRSRAIGLIVLDAVNPIFSDVASGAEDSARRSDRYLFVANSNQDALRELEYVRFFESQRVSGIIITPVSGVPPELREIERRGTPFVVVGEAMPGSAVNSVTGDDERGGYIAVRHLVEQGRRRLMMITGPTGPIPGRIRGGRLAAAESGLQLEVINTDKQSIAAGEAAAAGLLGARDRATLPDGIVAGNDLLALGIMQGLLRQGLAVPGDVALVGYDDLEFARTAMVPLTSVRLPVKEMGSTAVDLLVSLSDAEGSAPDPVELRFAPELMIRSSSVLP